MVNKKGMIEVAQCFLQVEPRPILSLGGMFMDHPYIDSKVMGYIDDNNEPQLFDISEEPEKLEVYKNQMMKRIDAAITSDPRNILFLIRKPYMMNYLRLVRKYIKDKEVLSDMLKTAWTSQEFPNWNERGHSLRTCLSMFKQVKDVIMDEGERNVYDRLPDIVTIYRGSYNDGKKTPYNALSWTSNPDKALWWVTHRYQNGIMWRASIKKEDIVCYLNNRSEEELIIDYTKIYNIEMVNYE